jgi:peptidyl-prolyl cis-trans isomerase SurA
LIQSRKGWRSASLAGMALALTLALTGCPNKGVSGDVVAKVNGYKIQRSEVDKAFKQQTAGTPQKLTTEQEQTLRLQILQLIINRQLYLQKAEKLGIVAPDEEVDNRLNQFKAPYTKEEFAKRLQDMDTTEDELKQDIRRKLIIEKLLNKEIAAKVIISDADIQNYYNEHKAQFNVIEPQYYLAHIFVSAQPNVPSDAIQGKAQNEAQAREKIRMIYNRLESGEDFAALAAKYSEDPDTARSGGELGATPESQLKNTDAATREAIAKLSLAHPFSDVIQITNPDTKKVTGFRIVKLLGKEVAGQRDLASVQQAIRTELRNQREQFLHAAYDEVLRDNGEIHDYYAEQILKNFGAQK